MAIRVSELTIDLPLQNVSANSLRRKIIDIAIGGQFFRKNNDGLSIRALDRVNFSVKNGERVGVVGHNGAGKTTLLRALAGVFEPNKGVIEVEGKVTALFGAGIGLDNDATGLENIKLMGAYLGVDLSKNDSRVEEIIDFCDLNNYIELPVKVYSTGMLGRLAFAVATSLQPDVLIMDEWLGAGDQFFIKKAQDRVNKFVESAKVVILASHSDALIEKIASKVVWLERGQVRFFGPTAEWKELYQAELAKMSAVS
jgi:ABC-type polysaccharide/polyol phosphate transport system ATPase subunit